jgi:hypothetical protein
MKNKIILYRTYLLFFISTILLLSCSNKKEQTKEVEENVNTFVLQGTNMMGDDSYFFTGWLIDLQDSILYIEAFGGDTLISAYLVEGDSLLLRSRFLANDNVSGYGYTAVHSAIVKEVTNGHVTRVEAKCGDAEIYI